MLTLVNFSQITIENYTGSELKILIIKSKGQAHQRLQTIFKEILNESFKKLDK